MKSVRLNADDCSLSQYSLVIVMTCYLHPKKSRMAAGDITKKTDAAYRIEMGQHFIYVKQRWKFIYGNIDPINIIDIS